MVRDYPGTYESVLDGSTTLVKLDLFQGRVSHTAAVKIRGIDTPKLDAVEVGERADAQDAKHFLSKVLFEQHRFQVRIFEPITPVLWAGDILLTFAVEENRVKRKQTVWLSEFLVKQGFAQQREK